MLFNHLLDKPSEKNREVLYSQMFLGSQPAAWRSQNPAVEEAFSLGV